MDTSNHHSSSSKHEDSPAPLEAVRSTLSKFVVGLTYDEACVLMRLAAQLRIGAEPDTPMTLEGDALAFAREAGPQIEGTVVYLTRVLVASRRCA